MKIRKIPGLVFTCRDLLRLGSSKPWQYAMKALTGKDKMDVAPLKEYFEPLRVWLQNETKSENHQWSLNECSHVTNSDAARDWLENYQELAEAAYSRSVEADWNYNTDIKQETEWKKVSTECISCHKILYIPTEFERVYVVLYMFRPH